MKIFAIVVALLVVSGAARADRLYCRANGVTAIQAGDDSVEACTAKRAKCVFVHLKVEQRNPDGTTFWWWGGDDIPHELKFVLNTYPNTPEAMMSGPDDLGLTAGGTCTGWLPVFGTRPVRPATAFGSVSCGYVSNAGGDLRVDYSVTNGMVTAGISQTGKKMVVRFVDRGDGVSFALDGIVIEELRGTSFMHTPDGATVSCTNQSK